MSHLPVSLIDRLSQTESAVFKLLTLYFQEIPFILRLFKEKVCKRWSCTYYSFLSYRYFFISTLTSLNQSLDVLKS